MEIKSSGLAELASWARSLGLSESGTRNDLARRIREHFKVPETPAKEDDNRKVITIDSAEITEYFKIEAVNEDYARLKGNVKLSLKDGDDLHNIKADEILFNRTRNILTAKGNVVYEKIESDGTTETFRGNNITVNIDDWAGFFLGGSSERKLESDGTSYLFSGTVMSKSNEDVTVLNKATITSANNPEALWSINASKVWLLPGSDFAILNAVLKVGEIPVMYFPAFFWPTDEIIFHPVIGYREREGGFVQTTTYIIGRPKADSSEQSSITRILGNTEDMEKELHGIFLKNTGKKIVNPTATSLKFLLDYYVNLGVYTGVDLFLPKLGILNSLDFTLGLGFSRTINQEGALGYTPYGPNYDGTFDWNHSNLFSYPVPFRYRMQFQSSLGGKYGNLSWNLPYYSDPYMSRDFLSRSETMDWINMLQQGSLDDQELTHEAEIQSYQWSMSGSLTPNVSFLNPVVSRASLSSISTSLEFKTLEDKDKTAQNPEFPERYNPNAPSRFFYAPNKFTIYSASGSITGSPVSIGGTASSTSSRSNTSAEIEYDDLLKDIGTPIAPWEIEQNEEKKPVVEEDILRPPELKQTFSLPGVGNLRFNAGYTITPTSSSNMQFINSNWKTYEQVDWSQIQSILTDFRTNANFNFQLNHSQNLFSNQITFSGEGNWSDYVFLNEEAFRRDSEDTESEIDEDKIIETRRQQYGQTNYRTNYEYRGTVNPLFNNEIFKSSNVSYSFKGILVRSKRFKSNEEPDGPELTPVWGSWVKDETIDGEYVPGLSAHQLSANATANISPNHSITASTNITLPPLDMLVTYNTGFKLWYSDTKADFRWKKPPEVEDPEAEGYGEPTEWLFEDINLSETIRYPNIGDLTFNMVINPRGGDNEDEYEIKSISSSVSLFASSLRASFRAVHSKQYEFIINEAGGRWQTTEDDPKLNPSEFSLSYSKNFRDIQVFPGCLSFNTNLSTSATYYLQEYTRSNFNFNLTFGMKVTNLLEINLTASSQNNVIWRYFKMFPSMADKTFMYIDGPQNNPIIDLWDSFNFFDDIKRQRSGFKMKGFNLSATHFLGDWNATLNIRMYTYLDQELMPPKYETTADVSFLVQWKPITEVKTDIRYEGEKDIWRRER